MPYNRFVDVYAGLATSIVTSNLLYAPDATEITMQVIGGSASTLTLQFSNVTGPMAGAAIEEGEWSTGSTVISTNNNFLNIEPGMRWVRGLRTSAASRVIFSLNNPRQ